MVYHVFRGLEILTTQWEHQLIHKRKTLQQYKWNEGIL